MAAKRYSPRELVLQLQAAGLTQKEIGARLGVHARTVRKWKLGETMPAPQRLEKLSKAATRAHRELAGRIDIERIERHHKSVKVGTQGARAREHALPRNVPIPRAIRLQIKNYQNGRWKKSFGYHLSDWVNYDVRGWNIADIERFVRALYRGNAASRAYFQVVFLAPSEDTSISGTPYLANKQMQRSGSGLQDLGGKSEDQIIREMRDQLTAPGRRPMYVAIARNRMRG